MIELRIPLNVHMRNEQLKLNNEIEVFGQKMVIIDITSCNGVVIIYLEETDVKM